MLRSEPLPAELTPWGRALAYPRLPLPVGLANRAFARLAPRLWRFEPEALKQAARKRTGLAQFGDLAPLDEPLAILCRSLTEEVELTPLGRLSVHSQVVNHLSHRLRLEELMRTEPAVFTAPVRMPVFIVGLPRSGTTFLQRLMSADPRWRTAPFWELMNPLPLGGRDPEPRIRSGATAIKVMYYTSPELAHMHEMRNLLPDEELPLLSIGHAASLYECMAMVPSYVRWYTTTDHTSGYRYLRRFLQAMQWLRPGGAHWLLKAPSHLENLAALHTVFPDATHVQTHRDPVTSVVSLANLAGYGSRGMYPHLNPHTIGRWAADFVERLLRAAVRDRAQAEERYVDVHYARLIGRPLREVRRVYEAAGADYTDEVEAALSGWLAADRAARTSRHVYRPEDFALDVDELRQRFAFYSERFDVPPEQRWGGLTRAPTAKARRPKP
jgi:hypothetical protein